MGWERLGETNDGESSKRDESSKREETGRDETRTRRERDEDETKERCVWVPVASDRQSKR